MSVDVHCHYAAPDFLDRVSEELGDRAVVRRPDRDGIEVVVHRDVRIRLRHDEIERLGSLEHRLSVMDTLGVRIQAISPPTFYFLYDQPPAVAGRLCSFLNDGLAAAAKSHPDRLVAMAALPLQDVPLAVAELERATHALGMRAVCIGSNVNGRGLDRAEFWPVYEAAEALGVLVFIHPVSSNLAGADRMQDYFLYNLVGNPLDTTLAAARLVFGGVLERFGDLRVCLAHGGGYLAWAIGRLNHGYVMHPDCRRLLARPPGDLLTRFYVDTLVHSSTALGYLVRLFGADHVVLGSDYPFPTGDPDPRGTVETADFLTHAERELICWGNAARLLHVTSGEDTSLSTDSR